MGRTKTVEKMTWRAAVLLCALLLGVSLFSQELRAQGSWGGNSSVTVNESVLDNLGPARSSLGAPLQPQGGAYTRYGGALLFPPQQAPRSTLTVPPPSAQALRNVPPVPRSAPRAPATARAQPARPSPAMPPAARAQQFPARSAPQTAAKPPAPAPTPLPSRQAAEPKQQPAKSAPQVLAPPPPPPPQPPQPAQPVAAAEPPKPPEETEKPKPAAPQTASTAPAATNGTQKAKTGDSDSLEEMDLPPPAPLPTLSEQAEPMVPTVGLDSSVADEPRQTLFTGGPDPSGIVLGGAPTKPVAPAAPPPPPPTPEPVTADDAKQAAPLATSTPKPQPSANDIVAAAPQPPNAQQTSASPPAAPTQQAALPPASAPGAGEVRVPFQEAQINLEDDQQALLAPLADQLNNNEQLAIRVQAYASGDASDPNKARRLSLQRALKVRKFFIDQGIRSVRVEVRALGMSGPDGSVDRVDVIPVER